MQKTEEINKAYKVAGGGSLQYTFLQRYLVDFIELLLPGIVFIVGAVLALAPPSYFLGCTLLGESPSINIETFLTLANKTPSTIWITFLIVILLLSYVFGQLFFRQPIGKPDKESFKRLVKKFNKDKNKEFTKKELNKKLACSNEDDCNFPYPKFKKYLKAKNQEHLILWSNSRYFKTEYINSLKMGLEFYFPEKRETIIQNERHVRLASSLWHVARFLIKYCVLSAVIFFIIGIAILIILPMIQDQFFFKCFFSYACLKLLLFYALNYLSAPIVILLVGQYIKSNIEKSLHYQRLREIFFVLETSYIASKENKHFRSILHRYKTLVIEG